MEQTDGKRRPLPRSRRTAKACIQCRQSKIKCSGDDPCLNCQRRGVRCAFAEGDNRVVVSESYLQDLQRRAAEQRQSPSASNPESEARAGSNHPSPVQVCSTISPASNTVVCASTAGGPALSTKRSANDAFGLNDDDNYPSYRTDRSLVSPDSLSQQHDVGPSPMSAPQPPNAKTQFHVWSSASTVPSKTIKNMRNNKRAWLWLAPWSTWSFTFRLVLLLREKLHPEDPDIPSGLVDTDIYSVTWKTSSPTDLPDISGLPSLNHAIYLFNTVKFHLGQAYRFFRADFEQEIRDFYANSGAKAAESRLWLVKYLLILAFGTAFLAPPNLGNPEPAGSKWFTRAMTLMPDTTSLWRDSLLAIEVLALAGIYLHSIDERESASLCLVQAIRIAQMEGMHTPLPENELGVETVTCCRDLWWTLYIMDRHFSASMGVPMSLQDSDITTPVNPPTQGSPEDSARSLQVNLSHLLAVILTSVYKPNHTPLDLFLEQTRSILHTLAHHAQEIERIFRVKFQNSVGTMPRDARLLALLYHKCVLFATRPLLWSVMKERLDILGNPGDENWESFLAQTRTVISTGIKSAAKTLHILTSGDSLLQSFLVYDLEFAFEAAIHLTMANALFPGVVDYKGCHQLAHQILDDLVARGNRVAGARRAELYHIEGLCQELVIKVQQQGHQTLHLFGVDGVAESDPARRANRGQQPHDRMLAQQCEPSGPGMDMVPWHHPLPLYLAPSLQMPSETEFLDSFGISSEEFYHIVQQMGDPETLPESMLTLS